MKKVYSLYNISDVKPIDNSNNNEIQFTDKSLTPANRGRGDINVKDLKPLPLSRKEGNLKENQINTEVKPVHLKHVPSLKKESNSKGPNLFEVKQLDNNIQVPSNRGRGDIKENDLKPLPLALKRSHMKSPNLFEIKPLGEKLSVPSNMGRGDINVKDLKPLPLSRKESHFRGPNLFEIKPLDNTENLVQTNRLQGEASVEDLKPLQLPNKASYEKPHSYYSLPLKRRFMEETIKNQAEQHQIEKKNIIKEQDVKVEDLRPTPLENQTKIIKEANNEEKVKNSKSNNNIKNPVKNREEGEMA